MTLFFNALKFLVDILFPINCIGCEEANTYVCPNCLSSFPKSEPINNPHVTALFDYRNNFLKKLIWQFKYRNARGIAKSFGGPLYDQIIGDISENLSMNQNRKLLLVPIPLHPSRERERGYNQSLLLVREILSHDSESIFEYANDALVRIIKTAPQAKKMKRAERIHSLKNVFKAGGYSIKGRHVILIDDVTTTGATLQEARNVLLKSGAKTVHSYTIAH